MRIMINSAFSTAVQFFFKKGSRQRWLQAQLHLGLRQRHQDPPLCSVSSGLGSIPRLAWTEVKLD